MNRDKSTAKRWGVPKGRPSRESGQFHWPQRPLSETLLGEQKEHRAGKLHSKPSSVPGSETVTAEQRHQPVATSRTLVAVLAMLFLQIFASLVPLIPQLLVEISHLPRGLPETSDQQ